MANRETVWVTLTQSASGSKLAWLVRELNEQNILSRIHGTGMKGPLLQVDEEMLHRANALLNQSVGELQVGVLNIDVTVDDLPNDHEYFDSSGSLAPVVKLGKQELTGPATSEDDDDDDEWDIDPVVERVKAEIEDVVGDELTSINILDVPDWEGELSRSLYVFEVNSSNMSVMTWAAEGPVDYEHQSMGEGTFYVRFKGGVMWYKYFPILEAQWDELYKEAVKAQRNDPDASLGSLFHHMIKVPANEGKINCWKLDGQWVPVIPAKKRIKATAKDLGA